MKCGICGATEYTRPIKESFTGKEVGRSQPRPIRERYQLEEHKQWDHPQEYSASIQKRLDGKRNKASERNPLMQRQRTKAKEIAKVVLEKYPYASKDEPIGTIRIKSTAYEYLHAPRYPNLHFWKAYQTTQHGIQYLQKEAKLLLEGAYENGKPVPDEDFQAVQAALEAVE